MTDPIMQPSPLPQQKKGMSKGCLISLIVVGIIGVVIIALGIVCYVYKDEIIAAGLSKMTEGLGNAIIENLPEGVTEDEVRTLMDDFTAAFKEGKINETEMQELSQRFQKIATKDTLS
ncbi:MAG: hypothetical protein JW763_11205 [candidate division Zixibacteria bacterium]|nr:hypothetical protein [candidate division Zixibacteria bacterium]